MHSNTEKQQTIHENKNEQQLDLLHKHEFDKEKQAEAKNAGTFKLQTEKLGNLLNEQFPPEVWVVDRLIPDESVTMLAGFSGSFKTWLYMDIAVRVAKGQKVFGRFNTKQTGVLVIDEESGRRRLQKRFKQLGANDDTPIYIASRSGRKMDEKYAKAIAQHAKELNAGLIVFDSFTRFNEKGDENASGDMSKLMDCYKQLAESGFAVLILHHNRKDNIGKSNAAQAMRGSSDIHASVDCHIAVSRSNQSEIVRLEQTKNRDMWESTIFKLRFYPNASEFEFAGADKTAAEKHAELLEHVMTLIKENPGSSQQQLIQLFKESGVKGGEKAVVGLLNELVLADKIKPEIGERNAYKYCLA